MGKNSLSGQIFVAVKTFVEEIFEIYVKVTSFCFDFVLSITVSAM